MPIKPLVSADPTPRSVQFTHFGVMNTGTSDKRAIATSVVTNIVLAVLAVVIGSVVKTKIETPRDTKDVTFVEPIKEPPPPPPPPRKLPPPPKVEPPKIQPPKIKMPDPIKPPPDIKPVIVPIPKPVVAAPAPPKAVSPPPAPRAVHLATPAPASIPNNDPHPSPIMKGNLTNPLKALTGPAVGSVNLGHAGAPGMNSANTGLGGPTKVVMAGSGCPNCTNMNGHDNGNSEVKGVKLGTPGGRGPLNSTNYTNQAVQPVLQAAATTHAPDTPQVQPTARSSPPVVISKPEPGYTTEARNANIQGRVTVRIHVSTSGTVTEASIVHGLGHGLDELALSAAQHIRFKPALDGSGHPVDWDGNVIESFQLN